MTVGFKNEHSITVYQRGLNSLPHIIVVTTYKLA
jgi:hypothetical protein